MPVSWFSSSKNQGASVGSRLSIDSRLVNGLTSLLFAVVLHNAANIISSMIIAFLFEWRVGMIGLVAMPLMLVAGFISMLFYGGKGDKTEEMYKKSFQFIA